MGRIVRIIVWAVILFAFYFFVSTIFKSCGSKGNSASNLNDGTEVVDSVYDDSEDEYFEDIGDDFELSDDEKKNDTTADDTEVFEEPIASSATSKPSSTTKKSSQNDSDRSPTKAKSTVVSSSGNYLVITGSFLMKSNADRMVTSLKKKGYSNAEMIIFEASQYHTVTSGRYANRKDANTIVKELKAAGIDCYSYRMN